MKRILYFFLFLWIVHQNSSKSHAQVEFDNLVGGFSFSYGVSELDQLQVAYRGGITMGFMSTQVLDIKIRADFSYMEFKDIYVNKTHYYRSYRRMPVFLGSRLQFRLPGVFKPYIEAGLEISFDRIIAPAQIIGAPFGRVQAPETLFIPRANDPEVYPQPTGSIAGLGSLTALGTIVFAPRGLVNPGSIVHKVHFGFPAGAGFNLYLGGIILGFNFRYHLTRQTYITFTPYLGIRI